MQRITRRAVVQNEVSSSDGSAAHQLLFVIDRIANIFAKVLVCVHLWTAIQHEAAGVAWEWRMHQLVVDIARIIFQWQIMAQLCASPGFAPPHC